LRYAPQTDPEPDSATCAYGPAGDHVQPLSTLSRTVLGLFVLPNRALLKNDKRHCFDVLGRENFRGSKMLWRKIRVLKLRKLFLRVFNDLLPIFIHLFFFFFTNSQNFICAFGTKVCFFGPPPEKVHKIFFCEFKKFRQILLPQKFSSQNYYPVKKKIPTPWYFTYPPKKNPPTGLVH
jgi:hypothetical protein